MQWLLITGGAGIIDVHRIARVRDCAARTRPNVSGTGLGVAHVHFVIRDIAKNWTDLERLTEADIARQPARFRTGVINWILQAYLRLNESLNAAGVTTSIDESIRANVVNIVHRDCLNGLSSPARRATIVGVRADRPPFELADFEILQNNVSPLAPHQFYMPFWPQPGLIGRDPARGTRLETMAYLGNMGTASAWLGDPRFAEELRGQGIAFDIRERLWWDYSSLDLVLAHRAEAPCMVIHKPASKLINAWLAGSVALLGPEPAYQKLRESPLDYLHVDSADQVFAAIKRLRTEPGLHAAMIERGRLRAAAFTVEAVRRRWLHIILEVALPRSEEIARKKTWLGQLARLSAQKTQSRVFKRRYRREIAAGMRYAEPADPP